MAIQCLLLIIIQYLLQLHEDIQTRPSTLTPYEQGELSLIASEINGLRVSLEDLNEYVWYENKLEFLQVSLLQYAVHNHVDVMNIMYGNNPTLGRPSQYYVYVPTIRFAVETCKYQRCGLLRILRQQNININERTVDSLIFQYNIDTSHWNLDAISDEQLQAIIRFWRFETNTISYTEGYRAVYGYLIGFGFRVQRDRVAAALRIVDPEGVQFRTHGFQQRRRREYNVKIPMEMWHLDANCKLKRYRLYIHGCVDGASHYIIYCRMEGRNNAETQRQIFQHAVQHVTNNEYPQHIRTERGLENTETWRVMLQQRGINTRAVLVGPSTRNTRIERLWLTLRVHKIDIWKRRFESMETHNGLDVTNSIHLWALHYIFIPRINNEFEAWRVSQNNHPHPSDTLAGVRRTPLQIFIEGSGQLTNEEQESMRQRAMENFNSEMPQNLYSDFNDYGAGSNPHSANMESDLNWNEVTWLTVPDIPGLTDALIDTIKGDYPPLADDGQRGVTLWHDVVQFITRNIQPN
eukprot:292750_1